MRSYLLVTALLAFACAGASQAGDKVRLWWAEIPGKHFQVDAQNSSFELSTGRMTFIFDDDDSDVLRVWMRVKAEQVGDQIRFSVIGDDMVHEMSHAWIGKGTLHAALLSHGEFVGKEISVPFRAFGKFHPYGETTPVPEGGPVSKTFPGDISAVDEVFVWSDRSQFKLHDDSVTNPSDIDWNSLANAAIGAAKAYYGSGGQREGQGQGQGQSTR